MILHFHRLPFHKLDGIPLTRNSAEITLMVTYHSGWVKMVVGNVRRLQYQYLFIAAQRIQVVKTTPFKVSIIVPLFPSCEKRFLTLRMRCFFTTNRMNCDGTRHIGMATRRFTVNYSILLHSSHIGSSRTPPLNLAVIYLALSQHSCSGPIQPS